MRRLLPLVVLPLVVLPLVVLVVFLAWAGAHLWNRARAESDGVQVPPSPARAGRVEPHGGEVQAAPSPGRTDFDVYRPEGAGDHPAVVVIHGGGWSNGDKGDVKDLCRDLADHGMVAVAVNHGLAPKVRFPEIFHDVEAGLEATQRLHGVDPSRIGVLGKSSGGHLAAMLAATHPVQAAVLMCAPLALKSGSLLTTLFPQEKVLQRAFGTDPALRRRFSPLRQLTGSFPPCLLIHGEKDPLVPCDQARRFHARLRQLGVDSTLRVVKNAGHDFKADGGPVDLTPAQLQEEMVRFLAERLEAR